MSPPLGTAGLLAGVPVDPGRDEARRLLLDELADPAYAQAQPNPVLRAILWVVNRILDALQNVPGNGSGVGAVVAAAVGVGAVVLIAWLVAGPMRRTSRVRRASGDVFGGTTLTADEHRAAARAAAAAGRWREAVQEAFRGLARGLDERAVIEVRAGLTAHEIAVAAAPRFPGEAGALSGAASAFDDVTYGDREGDRAVFEAVTATDRRLDQARPVRDASAPAQFQVPV